MKSIGALCMLILFAPVLLFANPDEDRQQILAAFESWNAGWNQRDADLAVQHYAHNTDWTNAFGDRFKSKDELREGLAFIFGLDFVIAGESDELDYIDVRFLNDSTAIVRSRRIRYGQLNSGGSEMVPRRINHLRLLERQGEQWLIVSHLIAQQRDRG